MNGLEDIVAGDEVTYFGRYGLVMIYTVTKTTPTMVVSGRHRWRRATGKPVGDRYRPGTLTPTTDAHRAQVAANAAWQMVRIVRRAELTDDQLIRIRAIFDEEAT